MFDILLEGAELEGRGSSTPLSGAATGWRRAPARRGLIESLLLENEFGPLHHFLAMTVQQVLFTRPVPYVRAYPWLSSAKYIDTFVKTLKDYNLSKEHVIYF